MSKRPVLSVVMPIHAGVEWISATLDSIAGGPTDQLEIIAIDSSPDGTTSAIIKQYQMRLPIRLEVRPDLTPWQTKTNLAIELATADYCCILHQDDLWLPGRMDAVRHWLEQAPECVLHLAPTLIVDGRGRRIGKWRCPLPSDQLLPAELLIERLLVQNFVSVPAPIFRRDAWAACGGMDEKLWYTPDWDIWLKFAREGPVVYHDDLTTAFRVHGRSLTVTGSRDAAEFRSQMEVVLDRHIDRVSPNKQRLVQQTAKASIDVNVALAAASTGSMRGIVRAASIILSLGPGGIRRYLRDSRLVERVLPRLRSKLSGAF